MCTDISGTKMLRQVGVRSMVISRNLEYKRCWIDAYSMDNISHFYHIHDTDCHDHDSIQSKCCIILEPILYVYICKVSSRVYIKQYNDIHFQR